MKRILASAVFLSLVVGGAFAGHSDPTVYVTKTGHKYHRGSCRYLSHSKIAVKLSVAVEEGMEPCKVCQPPVQSKLPKHHAA